MDDLDVRKDIVDTMISCLVAVRCHELRLDGPDMVSCGYCNWCCIKSYLVQLVCHLLELLMVDNW
jgi:hypothetical protein